MIFKFVIKIKYMSVHIILLIMLIQSSLFIYVLTTSLSSEGRELKQLHYISFHFLINFDK